MSALKVERRVICAQICAEGVALSLGKGSRIGQERDGTTTTYYGLMPFFGRGGFFSDGRCSID